MDQRDVQTENDYSSEGLLTSSNGAFKPPELKEAAKNTNSTTSNNHQQQQQPPSSQSQNTTTTTTTQARNLPSLEECLYGARTKKSPFIPYDEEAPSADETDTDDDDDDPSKSKELLDTSIDDDELHSRWSQNAEIRLDYHDIDTTILRKLCSHGGGIPEDDDHLGVCHRGVAWRVLLEQLPTRDIHASWPKSLPPKRKLYRELVSQYLDHAIDRGKSLKGTAFGQKVGNCDSSLSSKHPIDFDGPSTARIRQDSSTDVDENDTTDRTAQQQQTQQPSESDYPTTDEESRESLEGSLQFMSVFPDSSNSDNDNGNNDGDLSTHRSSWSDPSRRQASAHIRVTEDICNVFPPHSKYRELWKQSGITLNKGESAAAIGMNQLRIPKELLSENDENASTDRFEFGEDSYNEGHGNIPTQDDSQPTTVHSHDEVSDATKTAQSRNDRIFRSYCKDAKLLEEIRKDVVRTHPHLRFYLEPKHNLCIRRHAAIERILFVWAKLNGNLYVQGMNEIVGTIYYVLANDKSTSSPQKDGNAHCWADHAEADTYYLFHILMSTMDIRDVFVAALDHDSTVGLHARITNIEGLLQKHDPEIYRHLKQTLKLDTSFYAIRWLTTLLSREFMLPDTIRLWDSMFASTHKENFLRYVCASMVMAIRSKLFRGDFGTCLKLLQNYPSGEIGMDELLQSSRALWIYETQISLACRKGGIPLHQALQVIVPPPGIIMAFGFKGGIQPKLSDQISEAANMVGEKGIGVIRNVGAAAAANPNVSKMMGRAKRLWSNKRRNVGEKSNKNNKKSNETVSSTNTNGGENGAVDPARSNQTKANNIVGATDDWDIIDSIIDGSSDLLSRGGSTKTPSMGSLAIAPTGMENTAASNVEASLSPKARDLWNRIRENTGSPTNEYSSNAGTISAAPAATSKSTSGGFWNRVRR